MGLVGGDDLNDLTERVIGCAFDVSNELGAGFLERVYENALTIVLREAGLHVEQQKPISVLFHGQVVGEYVVDLLVESQVLIELKAVKTIQDVHKAQCLNYLRATGLKTCLLINFGEQVQVKRLRL
ncbi:MAG: GxxExxY protein [Planctomycetota bacterium]